MENAAIADGHGMKGAIEFHAANGGASHGEGVDPICAVKAAFGDERFEGVFMFAGGGADRFRANGDADRIAVAGRRRIVSQ